jgi:hypothetical protein
MTSIDELMTFCLDKYHSPAECEHCINDDYCINDENGKKSSNCHAKCIYHINRNWNRTRTYNCENMALCYVLLNIYRFVSEIEALYEDLKLENRFVGELRIASIGCGPSSELYAIADYEENKGLKIDYSFKGFDLNPIWSDIWSFNQTKFPSSEFISEDIFDYYDNNPDSTPQILILNYMLSDMVKLSNRDNVETFLDKLVTFIDKKIPNDSFILFNNIPFVGSTKSTNLDSAYNCLEYLSQSIKGSDSTEYIFYKRSFNKLAYTGSYYGGKKCPNNELRMKRNYEMYNKICTDNKIPQFPQCNSIQLIIRKKTIGI